MADLEHVVESVVRDAAEEAEAGTLPAAQPCLYVESVTDSAATEASVRKLLTKPITTPKIIRKPDTGALRAIDARARLWQVVRVAFLTKWRPAEHNLVASSDERLSLEMLLNKTVDAAAATSANAGRDEEYTGAAYAMPTAQQRHPDPFFFSRGGSVITGDPAASLRTAVADQAVERGRLGSPMSGEVSARATRGGRAVST